MTDKGFNPLELMQRAKSKAKEALEKTGISGNAEQLVRDWTSNRQKRVNRLVRVDNRDQNLMSAKESRANLYKEAGDLMGEDGNTPDNDLAINAITLLNLNSSNSELGLASLSGILIKIFRKSPNEIVNALSSVIGSVESTPSLTNGLAVVDNTGTRLYQKFLMQIVNCNQNGDSLSAVIERITLELAELNPELLSFLKDNNTNIAERTKAVASLFIKPLENQGKVAGGMNPGQTPGELPGEQYARYQTVPVDGGEVSEGGEDLAVSVEAEVMSDQPELTNQVETQSQDLAGRLNGYLNYFENTNDGKGLLVAKDFVEKGDTEVVDRLYKLLSDNPARNVAFSVTERMFENATNEDMAAVINYFQSKEKENPETHSIFLDHFIGILQELRPDITLGSANPGTEVSAINVGIRSVERAEPVTEIDKLINRLEVHLNGYSNSSFPVPTNEQQRKLDQFYRSLSPNSVTGKDESWSERVREFLESSSNQEHGVMIQYYMGLGSFLESDELPEYQIFLENFVEILDNLEEKYVANAGVDAVGAILNEPDRLVERSRGATNPENVQVAEGEFSSPTIEVTAMPETLAQPLTIEQNNPDDDPWAEEAIEAETPVVQLPSIPITERRPLETPGVETSQVTVSAETTETPQTPQAELVGSQRIVENTMELVTVSLANNRDSKDATDALLRDGELMNLKTTDLTPEQQASLSKALEKIMNDENYSSLVSSNLPQVQHLQALAGLLEIEVASPTEAPEALVKEAPEESSLLETPKGMSEAEMSLEAKNAVIESLKFQVQYFARTEMISTFIPDVQDLQNLLDNPMTLDLSLDDLRVHDIKLTTLKKFLLQIPNLGESVAKEGGRDKKLEHLLSLVKDVEIERLEEVLDPVVDPLVRLAEVLSEQISSQAQEKPKKASESMPEVEMPQVNTINITAETVDTNEQELREGLDLMPQEHKVLVNKIQDKLKNLGLIDGDNLIRGEYGDNQSFTVCLKNSENLNFYSADLSFYMTSPNGNAQEGRIVFNNLNDSSTPGIKLYNLVTKNVYDVPSQDVSKLIDEIFQGLGSVISNQDITIKSEKFELPDTKSN